MDLYDKHCVITGGASGIGAACARRFSALGARVVIADINESGARSISDEIGGLAVKCDVSLESDVHRLFQMATAENGDIALFFCNAGVSGGSDPLQTDLSVWHRMWQVNVMAHLYAIREVLPSMLARAEGYFVHTASMAGILTTHDNLPYATTKHAVVGLAEWMSIAYHDKGIRTSLLAPLGVNTPMLAASNSVWSQSAAGPIKEPEEVATMVCDAIHEERFLIVSDPIAHTWMYRKNSDLERWLRGMRRLQKKIEDAEFKV